MAQHRGRQRLHVFDGGREAAVDEGAGADRQHQRLAGAGAGAPGDVALDFLRSPFLGARGADEFEDRGHDLFADRHAADEALGGAQVVGRHGRAHFHFLKARRLKQHAPLGLDIAVSKRLGTGPERAALARRIEQLATGAGWIVRAGAAQVSDELLAAESEALHLQWRAIRDDARAGSAPRLLHPGPDAPTRALIEQGAAAPAAILVDDLAPAGGIRMGDGPLLSALRDWCDRHAPDLLPRLSAHTDAQRLFDLRDLDSAIAELLDVRVALPLGGSLVIERTEALTVIDVNAGERGNPLEVNLDAAAEIARQLRLRNVGGIVVVDFVNMRSRGDAERVLAALSQAVESDPVQTQVYGMSKLGLVELTRARRGTPLAALLRP